MLHATDLDPDQVRLLRDMGLSERHPLCVCKAGEPCIVQVQTTRLGISARLAARILVTPVDEETRGGAASIAPPTWTATTSSGPPTCSNCSRTGAPVVERQ